MRRLIAIGTATLATAAVVGMFATSQAGAASSVHATLRDAAGKTVGTVTFKKDGGSTLVIADFKKNANVTTGTFHGFHIHANNLPADDLVGFGSGCKASGTDPAKWFLSADGHYSTSPAQTHGAHAGDMPSVLVEKNGAAHLSFTTDRIKVKDLKGKAVMLHAGPDNFGNIPLDETGKDHLKYMSNGPEALLKTAKTGNSGDRVACGVVQ
jgi:Cu-Zn family superoxide dismutase